MRTNVIQTKTYQFALTIVGLHQGLQKKKEFVISKQILKSATSVGANVEEALAAQSRKDFISKMTIALKEARETRYWLRLIEDSHMLDEDLTIMLMQIEEIIKILASIIITTKDNL
jgi:four helix bundle protein